MKKLAAALSIALLAGCSGMSMHNQSGDSNMAMSGSSSSGNAGAVNTRYGYVFAPTYPSANPNDPVNNLYFGG